jgi:flagellin
MGNSINTNISAYFAQANIGAASASSSSSVSRLSSGNRIVKASDDVAALSTGTSLKTQVLALKTALTNASQGTSLLQVADGALSQVTEILQRQKAISLQAGSGSLTDTDRGYLDQEFQALSVEIDRLTGATNFNGVKLLNGSLSTSAAVAEVDTASTKGSLSLNFGSSNILVGEVVTINGTTLTAVASGATGAQFNLGANITESISNLADRLNTLADSTTYNSTLGEAIFSANGSALTATARAGGTLSNSFRLDNAPPAAITLANNGVATNTNTSVDITTGSAHGYSVGQRVIINTTTNAAVGGLSVVALRGVITAVGSTTTFTFTAQGAATSTTTGGGASATVILDSANTFDEATVTGGTQASYFNLFATTTGFTSATTQISASTTAVATPFKDGDTFTATVNGTSYNLHTFGTNDTLKGLVDGINASAPTTGFTADLIMDNNNRYNVRIKYEGNAGNIIINGGTNYHSAAAATNLLSGDNMSGVGTNGTVGAFTTSYTGKSVISTGYVDVTGAAGSTAITVANSTTVVTAAVGATAAGTPFAVGDSMTITINGETKTLHTYTATDTLNTILTSINSKQADTGVYAAILSDADGLGAYNIRLYTTVPTPASDQVLVSVGANAAGATSSTVTKLTTTNAALSQVVTSTMKGGIDDGIGKGDTNVTGSIGDSILQTLGTTKANASILFTGIPVANDYITVGGQRFFFTANTTGAPNEILIGSTVQETVNNAVAALHNYVANGHAVGTTGYEFNQLNITATEDSLVFTAKGLGDVKTLSGGNAAVSQNLTNGALVGGTLTNDSTNYGVDVTGIANSAFTGSIQGFKATYTGTADTIDLSIKIGDFTYTAQDVDATVTSDTRIRLYSDTVGGKNGGYFDIQLKANQVNSFTTQGAADAVAARLDGAFSSLNFMQTRNISSFAGTGSITAGGSVIGSLQGSSVSAQLESFENVNLSDVKVTAPSGSNTDVKITLTINGVDYSTSSGIGSNLGAHQTYKLVSSEDPNQFVNFTTGDTEIDIDSAEKALAVQSALKTAFGATAGSSSLSFQVGASSTDTLEVSIGSAQTASLYAGKSLNVLTQEDAIIAGDQLDIALATVTSLRASVGALQSRFNFASANIQIAVQNQDAARGELLDTDVATESTAFATSQVKLQAGISVLAQANQQLQNLLKLIQ